MAGRNPRLFISAILDLGQRERRRGTGGRETIVGTDGSPFMECDIFGDWDIEGTETEQNREVPV